MNSIRAIRLVRELMEAEFSSGFAFVRRVPSIDTWKTLAHVETLSPEERNILFDVLAERNSGWLEFFGVTLTSSDVRYLRFYERQKELVAHPSYQCFIVERTHPWPFKYADPSFMRGWLDGMRRASVGQATPLSPPDFDPVPLAVVEAAEAPVTATAAEIRKEIKRAFTERFHIQPTNMGSGVWNYPGEHDGRPFTLTLNWGRIFKLRYGISVGRFPAKQGLTGLSWEEMLGLGIGHWNFVCQHNLAQSVALLGEIIEKMVMLPDRLSAASALHTS